MFDEQAEGSTTPISVRMPDSLRARLSDRAISGGRSLNAEIVNRLRASLSPSAFTLEKVFGTLALPKAIRLASSSTTTDFRNLVLVAEQLGAESLLLGARADKLNNAVLVAILETPYVRCLMDSTLINMARDPRIGEVQQLFQHFDQLGLLDKACACTVLVPSTSTLPVEEAIETIARDGKPKPLELQSYLNLLAQRWEVQDTRPYRRDR